MYPNTDIQVSVEEFLQSPTLVSSVVGSWLESEGTIADYAFAAGSANNGAIIYERYEGEVASGTREAGIVAPGNEFPELDLSDIKRLPASVDKYAGKEQVTWEAVRRNSRDEVGRKTRQVARKVVRAVNRGAVATLRADPLVRQVTLGSWATASGNQKLSDIFDAMGRIANGSDEAYTADLILINPEDKFQYLLPDEDIHNLLPKENAALNPVLSGDINGLLGVDWIADSNVPRGELIVMQRGITGSINDEHNGVLQTDVFPDRRKQVEVIHGWRDAVAVINNPLSAVRLTGFHA